MTAASLLLYLPGTISGFLLVHLLWSDISLYALILKASLGIGLGLGLSSIFYFASLLIAPGRANTLWVMVALLLVLIIVTFLRRRRASSPLLMGDRPTLLQWGLFLSALIATAFLLMGSTRLVAAQPQGAFDAWAIWNRAARFIHRDPTNWQATLAPEQYWANHPDYPLLVPLNIAWAWDTLGTETLRAPAVQAMLFMLGGLGLLFSALALTKSLGQASLGLLLLSATPLLAISAWGLLADVPIMYFITASLILMYLAFTRRQAGLMVLAGFMAGLAAWTKNEGLLFLLASVLGLTLTRYGDLRRSFFQYALGAALPLVVVLYFKSLAPPNDIFAAGDGLAKLADPARYLILLKALGEMVLHFGDWPISLPLALILYAIIVHTSPPPGSSRNIFTIAAIITLQFLGSCAIYLLTPYDLEWHLRTSLARVLLQIFPAALFVYLLLVREPA